MPLGGESRSGAARSVGRGIATRSARRCDRARALPGSVRVRARRCIGLKLATGSRILVAVEIASRTLQDIARAAAAPRLGDVRQRAGVSASSAVRRVVQKVDLAPVARISVAVGPDLYGGTQRVRDRRARAYGARPGVIADRGRMRDIAGQALGRVPAVIVGILKANALIVAGLRTGGTKSALQGARAHDRLAREYGHGDHQGQRSASYRN